MSDIKIIQTTQKSSYFAFITAYKGKIIELKRFFDFPAEGRTFLRTLGAQRASVRPYVRTSKKSIFQMAPD